MKAISLLQPWASLVVMGAKKYETRSWNTFYRGRILIHASQGKEAGMNLWYLDPFDKYIKDFNALPFGAIIGECKIEMTMETELVRKKLMGTDEYLFGDYSTGRMAWRLVQPVQYKRIIPCKGQLNVWDVPEEVLKALTA